MSRYPHHARHRPDGAGDWSRLRRQGNRLSDNLAVFVALECAGRRKGNNQAQREADYRHELLQP